MNDLKFRNELATLVSDFVDLIISMRIDVDVELRMTSPDNSRELRVRRKQLMDLETRLMAIMRRGVNRLIVSTKENSDN